MLGVSDSRGLASGRGGVSWLEMVRVPPSFGTDTIDTMMPLICWASRWRAAAGCSRTWPARGTGWTSRCSWWPGGAGRWSVGGPRRRARPAVGWAWCRRPGNGPLVGEASTWVCNPGLTLLGLPGNRWRPFYARLAGWFPCLALCLAMAMQPRGIYAR